jgi:hypothetical protein
MHIFKWISSNGTNNEMVGIDPGKTQWGRDPNVRQQFIACNPEPDDLGKENPGETTAGFVYDLELIFEGSEPGIRLKLQVSFSGSFRNLDVNW